MLGKGIQFGEVMERIIVLMAFEHRYLKAVTVVTMGKSIPNRGNSNYKVPEVGECLACLRDHQEARMAAPDSEQGTGNAVTGGCEVSSRALETMERMLAFTLSKIKTTWRLLSMSAITGLNHPGY